MNYAASRFGKRLGEWAIGLMKAEVTSGFRLIRTVRCEPVHRFLGIADGLSGRIREQFAIELTRRVHAFPTRNLSSRVELFLNTAAWPEARIQRAHIDRRRLREELRQALTIQLGDPEIVSPAVWFHRQKIGPWIISTDLDCASRFWHVTCGHSVSSVDGNFELCRGISLLKVLGIWPQTHWQFSSTDEISKQVADVVQCVKTVTDGVSSCLRALEP